jgi:hypothetical protein
MAWFASSDDRRHDPRTVELAGALGVNRHEALGLLDCLYGWTASHAPSGDLGAFSDAAIASACDWAGPADQLVPALLEAGVLTPDATIADWYELFGRYAKQREAGARRVAKHRSNGSGNGARNASGNAPGNGARNGSSNAPGNALRNGSSNGARNGVGNADAPSPPDPLSPGRPPTGVAPTAPSEPSEPPGDAGVSTPGLISGPAPGARAREERPVPKPTPAQVRLARVVDLVRDAGVEIFPSSRDGAAVKTCSAPADRIAEAYIAAARGEWDPGGDGWLGDSLSVHLVISRLAGYRPTSGADYFETRRGRLRPAEVAF